MNVNLNTSSWDRLESRFAFKVTARLSERSQDVSADVSERLRFAREQAIARARLARQASTAPAVSGQGVTRGGAALLGGMSGWWFKLAAVLPALALIAGLVSIQTLQDSTQISAAADIDAALLADDLPPDAYSDAGFVEFLKTPPRE